MEKRISAFGVFVPWLFDLASFNAHWNDYRDWGMMGPMMGWGWWGGWLGWIFMFVFWALIIIGLIFLVKWLVSLSRSRGQYEKGSDSVLDILKQRYARGEINKEEFDQKKRDLM